MAESSPTNGETMRHYATVVTITTNDIANAEQALTESLHHDKSYGFPCTIEFDKPQPKELIGGISIDASTIRERLEYLIEEYKEDEEWEEDEEYEEDEEDYTINLYNAIRAMDDGQLNALILATRDLRTWEIFNELSDRILDEVIESVERDKGNS